ncbi:hypothetical protein ScPMuIL_012066, partial [Solemya velum]
FVCGNCHSMPQARECVCCQEITRVNERRTGKDENTSCITDLPSFRNVCLNPDVLDVAYFQYRQEYGEQLPEAANELVRNRYTAYRQFVRWCWGYLGKEIQVVIPACIVLSVRNSYPDPGQNYTGFRSVAG